MDILSLYENQNQIIDINKKKNNEKFMKIINKITVMTLVMIFLFIYIPGFIAEAESYTPTTDGRYAHFDDEGNVIGYVTEIPDGAKVNDGKNNKSLPEFFCESILESVLKPTTEILTGTGEYAPIYNKLMTLNLNSTFGDATTVLKEIAAAWVLIIALTHLIQGIGQGQDPLDCTYKFFIEFSVTGMFIVQSGHIIDALTGLGQLIAKAFGNQAFDFKNSIDAETLLEAVTGKDDGYFMWFIQATASFFIPWLLSILASILAKFVAIQVLLEIAVRKMFAPIAIADIYREGLRSPGARYLKKYFACVLKLSVCIFICLMIATCVSAMFNQQLTDKSSGNCFEYMFGLLTVEISAAMLMFKAGEFANDAVGV